MKKSNLDRIDNTKGYTKKNLAVCCWRCNRKKGHMNLTDLVRYLKVAISHGVLPDWLIKELVDVLDLAIVSMGFPLEEKYERQLVEAIS